MEQSADLSGSVGIKPTQVAAMNRPAWKLDREALACYMEIIKPRIATMVLFTVWAGAVGSGWASENLTWIHAMVGTLLVAASGSAFTQYLERFSDFYMPRTAGRPLPGGRLSSSEVVTFGAITFGVGMSYLAATVHWSSTLWCFVTWVCYV